MCECVRERTGKRERETILVILPLHQHCYLEAVQSILNSITSITKTTTLHNSASYNKRQHLCTRIKKRAKAFRPQTQKYHNIFWSSFHSGHPSTTPALLPQSTTLHNKTSFKKTAFVYQNIKKTRTYFFFATFFEQI